MNAMSAAIERLRFAVRTLPGVLAGFSEAERTRRGRRDGYRATCSGVVGAQANL
jgi:hypothetical protein